MQLESQIAVFFRAPRKAKRFICTSRYNMQAKHLTHIRRHTKKKHQCSYSTKSTQAIFEKNQMLILIVYIYRHKTFENSPAYFSLSDWLCLYRNEKEGLHLRARIFCLCVCVFMCHCSIIMIEWKSDELEVEQQLIEELLKHLFSPIDREKYYEN